MKPLTFEKHQDESGFYVPVFKCDRCPARVLASEMFDIDGDACCEKCAADLDDCPACLAEERAA